VYTWTDDGSGYQPSLRQYALPATSLEADASTVSGFRQSTVEAFVAQVPVGKLPRGMSHLYARVRRQGGAGATNVFWEVSSERGATRLAQSATGSFTRSFNGSWEIIPIGQMVARAVAVKPSSDSFVRVAILTTGLDLDEAWLCNTDREVGVSGAVSLVSCGVSKLLSIEAPSSSDPYPRVFVGDSADDEMTWTHASDPQIQAFGLHVAQVPAINAFTVCDALDSRLEQEAFPRWHTFPAA